MTSVVSCDLSIDQLYALYNAYYEAHPFTHVSSNNIDLKQVVNTNKCLVHIEKQGNKIAIQKYHNCSCTHAQLKRACAQLEVCTRTTG